MSLEAIQPEGVRANAEATSARQPEATISVSIVDDETGLRQSITTFINGSPGFRCISAYGSELNQVWTALIENALDVMAAAGGKGVLKLCCRLEGEMMLVEIWDTGPGIPPELQDRIFEPFFTTKAPGQGLGLGLDNAMRIVRKHRGHLGVRSEPGSTCFRVRLPLDQFQAY